MNSPADELAAVLDATGTELYFSRTVTGQNDLYVAHWQDSAWGRPNPLLELNSPIYNETNPTISRDGSRLYFVSDRVSGSGGFDVWAATRNGDVWADPQLLGPAVNSEDDEWFAAEGPEGLYISARMAAGSNRGDILYAAGDYPEFDVRQAIPALATPAREMSAYPTADGTALLVTSDRSGGPGKDDLWQSEADGGTWSSPEQASCNLSAPDFDQYPTLSHDGLTLVFASYNRPGGLGGTDLYTATWRALGDMNGDQRASTADIIHLVNYLFKSGPPPVDSYTDDPNCDGTSGMVDVVILVNYVLRFGAEPCNQCEL